MTKWSLHSLVTRFQKAGRFAPFDSSFNYRPWEGDAPNGSFGRAVYSLRDYSEVAELCNVLLASACYLAGRHDLE